MSATTTAATPTPPAARPARTQRLRNPAVLAAHRVGYEVRSYFRQSDTLFFTFSFPLLMLTIFSVAFSSSDFGDDQVSVTAAQYYLPAMLAAGVLLSGLQNLAIDIATEKNDGTLKRLAGTPLPPASYLAGKLGQVVVTGCIQAALVIALAAVAFGVPLPTDLGAWLTFAWVLLLGMVTCGLLGIGLSALPRSGRSASAVITPPVLFLQFISGVYLPFNGLPSWLQDVAALFPLKWLAQGMRSVFLPEEFAAVEAGGAWDLGGVALACAVWLVVGAVLCRVTFRWVRQSGR
ncbi:ABC transporter permease [Sanguibacter suaedae]|uniref:Transport permease protein n=1 Tax=Sanguibacter suaedae TaxID=2795737 RepID=A0A934M625_9MICO|nr:ABC transporter permease [Sanguibacter suaedae]MBI9113772.1 ABC transporter permease [Sanguibacter suaedae]